MGLIHSLKKRLFQKVPMSIWSIKTFRSDTLISKPPEENLLTPSIQASDVNDVNAQFVADPFLVFHGSQFYLFFEVLDESSGKGIIGLATSKDGDHWKYEQIVLKEKFHLSYPYVLKYKNEFYMIPETSETNKVLLYKARNFPYDWEITNELIRGKYVDVSVFQFDNKWWMFAGEHGKLHLFYSNDLINGWIEHPKSPIITNNINITRPAGRVIVDKKNIYRYSQDSEPYYGRKVRAFKINTLTTSEYQEEELGIVLTGSNQENDWHKDGMHTLEQQQLGDNQWIIAVDGHMFKNRSYISWKYKNMLVKVKNYLAQLKNKGE